MEKARREAGLFCESKLKQSLELFVEIAHRARDIDSARNAAFTVLDALDDARGFLALGTVRRLRRVHHLLAIASFGNFGHGWGDSPS